MGYNLHIRFVMINVANTSYLIIHVITLKIKNTFLKSCSNGTCVFFHYSYRFCGSFKYTIFSN